MQVSLCTYVSFFRVEIHYLNIEMNSRYDIEVVDYLFFRDLFRKHKIKCLPFINLINSTHTVPLSGNSHLIDHLILSLYTEYKKPFKVILIVNSPIIKTNVLAKIR